MDAIILFLISLSFTVPNILVKLYHGAYIQQKLQHLYREHRAVHGQHCAHGGLEDPVKKRESLISFSFGYSNSYNAVNNRLCRKAT